MFRIKSFALLILVIISVSVTAQAAQQKRLLAISLMPSLEPYPADNNTLLQRYVGAIDLAYNAGVQGAKKAGFP